jgi:hypothetical protein
MRISVYRKGSNPRVDPAFLRKSASYVRSLVASGDAEWWDKTDELKGCILRREKIRESSCEHMIAAGNMRNAWVTQQSGYAGPLVLQLAN